MLDSVLGKLARSPHPDLLVGFDTADDAAVYRLAPDLALVQTVDFFTPIVDDPAQFGQIAAANALSDVYAMGGRPITALSILAFPEQESPDLLEAILQGGIEKLEEAHCTLAGGHSVRDDEVKFGYAITGLVHPDRILTNSKARPGDALVLTKAIGTGIITTAAKAGRATNAHLQTAIASMCQLNRIACEVLLTLHPHAVTDITGFGLLGHAREMAAASGVQLRLAAHEIPLLPGALECVPVGICKGLRNNREFAECVVEFAPGIDETLRALLFDPQTSGGLLISLPEGEAGKLVRRLRDTGLPAARIGLVAPQAGEARASRLISVE